MSETGTEPSAPSTHGPDWGSADYEIVAQLSSGPLGKICLASIVRGRDAGRLVRLRSVPHAMAGVLAQSVELGSRIAHARLLKVLGLAVVDGELNVASEFVEGATLWELSRTAIDRKRPIPHAVALRIVSDLLYASIAARRAFRKQSGVELQRCLWPDTAWIAAFGEALLSEPGLGATLALGPEAAEAYLSPEEARGEIGGAASDVFAAGVLLWELFANRSLFGPGDPAETAERVRSQPIARLGATGNFGDPVSEDVARIVDRALARSPAERYVGPEEMTAEIALLPKHLVASDRDVQLVLEDLMQLEQQRRTAATLAPSSGSHEVLWDIPTRSLRVPRALTEKERITLRPSEERITLRPSEERITLRPSEERITLRPSEERALASGAPSTRESVRAPASIPVPAFVPAPPVTESSAVEVSTSTPIPTPTSRRLRNVVIAAVAIALSAAAAYAATRAAKLGAVSPAIAEPHAAVSPATHAVAGRKLSG